MTIEELVAVVDRKRAQQAVRDAAWENRRTAREKEALPRIGDVLAELFHDRGLDASLLTQGTS